jgi:acyl-coenzyme A thioesterase PaaI-like protein
VGQMLLPQLLAITARSQIQEAGRCGCTALEMALLIASARYHDDRKLGGIEAHLQHDQRARKTLVDGRSLCIERGGKPQVVSVQKAFARA